MWVLYLFWQMVAGVRQFLGLIFPIFSAVTDFRGWSPTVRRVVRAIILVTILVGLWFLQTRIPGAGTYFKQEWLKNLWLPILFLLFYALTWIAHAIWLLWMTEEDTSDFPDIDDAWGEALKAMQAADIDLRTVPLFLVLGRPAGGEEAMFSAAGLPLTVQYVPPRASAPLHVFANKHDAVFVTCAGASRLGLQARVLGLTSELIPSDDDGDAASPADEDNADATMAAGKQKRMKHIVHLAQVLDAARRKGRNPSQMTEEERQTLLVLERADKPEEAELQTARLEHLCRLIAKARRPECPINGVLVLVPLRAMLEDADAGKTATVCESDLNVARATFQMQFPMITLVSDLETAPGFTEFLDGFLAHCKSEDERKRERRHRLGRRFGWGANVGGEKREEALTKDIRWIGHGMFPIQIYQNLLQIERADRETLAENMQRNGRLCRFMVQMREGERRLKEIVLKGLESRQDGPALLGGCYFAATGGGVPAFVAGVFKRLLDAQAYVAWTDEALAEDAAHRRWARYGFVALPLFTLATVAFLYVWQSGALARWLSR